MPVLTSTDSTFRYVYESSREEFIESCTTLFGETIVQQSKWRPSIPLLIATGIAGGATSMMADTIFGKIICFLAPIAVAGLLMISSKQTRVESVRNRIEMALSKNYDDKKCHFHDFHLDDEGFVERCPCGTDTRNWESIRSWHETEKMIVLETLSRTCYAIPKRVIPSAEVQPLRDLISRHVHQS